MFSLFPCIYLFSGNDLNAEYCEVLAATLLRLDDLKELHLDDNDIESEGIVALIEGLKKDRGAGRSLAVLSVCTCCITAYGAIKLAKSVDNYYYYYYYYLISLHICYQSPCKAAGIFVS